MNKILLLFLLVPFWSSCQTINLRTVTALPSSLSETSGLVVESANRFWSHNDSGGEPKVYQIDSSGQLLRTVTVTNATNVDWEEIALDNAGNLYIGDFGNNAQNRRNLMIYKVLNFRQNNNSEATAEKIEFSYEDQTAFPPADSAKHFDAEAMIVANDSIFVLTKDFDSKPYSGKTWIYRLPNQVGKHVARLVAIFDTDNASQYNGAVTAAAVSGDGKVAILTYQKLWILRGYPNRAFWRGNAQVFTFGLAQFAQREAVAFGADNCTLYTTSERTQGIGGNLSAVNICALLLSSENSPIAAPAVKVYPNPSVGDVFVDIAPHLLAKMDLVVYDGRGQKCFSKPIARGETKIVLDNALFPSEGMYFYRLFGQEPWPLKVGKILIIR